MVACLPRDWKYHNFHYTLVLSLLAGNINTKAFPHKGICFLLTSLSSRLNLLDNTEHSHYPHFKDPTVVNQLSTCLNFCLCSSSPLVSSHENYSGHGWITSLLPQWAVSLPRVTVTQVKAHVRTGVLQTSDIQARHARLQQLKGKAPAMTAVHWAPTGPKSFATGFVKTLCLTIPIVASVVNLYAVPRAPKGRGAFRAIATTTQGSLYTDTWNLV